VCGALEHDVLEEMGEPGLADLLVLRADVVPDVDRDDRHEVVLGHDDAEPVRQARVGEIDPGHGHADSRELRDRAGRSYRRSGSAGPAARDGTGIDVQPGLCKINT
jgi:hypothetical protein